MQRAKRALQTQLKLRGETARKAQKLRVDRELAGVALGTGDGEGDEGGGKGSGEETRMIEEEIEELEASVAAASKVRKRVGQIIEQVAREKISINRTRGKKQNPHKSNILQGSRSLSIPSYFSPSPSPPRVVPNPYIPCTPPLSRCGWSSVCRRFRCRLIGTVLRSMGSNRDPPLTPAPGTPYHVVGDPVFAAPRPLTPVSDARTPSHVVGDPEFTGVFGVGGQKQFCDRVSTDGGVCGCGGGRE